MQSLYWQTSGKKNPQIVLLHGWGLNAQVWHNIFLELRSHFSVHLVDLPGFGRSQGFGSLSLPQMADCLLRQAPPKAIWLGWSLGGLLASHIAIHHPRRVQALITVASSPCFIAKETVITKESAITKKSAIAQNSFIAKEDLSAQADIKTPPPTKTAHPPRSPANSPTAFIHAPPIPTATMPATPIPTAPIPATPIQKTTNAADPWPGIAPHVLTQFQQQLNQNYQQTVERFLALQTLGSQSARQDLRALKHAIFDLPAPPPEVLNGGLQILKTTDLRQPLRQITAPFLRIYGKLDGLVPRSIAPLLDLALPHSPSVIIDKAAHAPFLSHPEQFLVNVLNFCQTQLK